MPLAFDARSSRHHEEISDYLVPASRTKETMQSYAFYTLVADG
jgi:hypothetical protein